MTTGSISASLRRLVIDRAEGKCEYCRLHQDFSIYTHEVDHVIAQKHGDETTTENLSLACLPCNRHKGSDLTTFDPTTGELVLLFNPRQHYWGDHFRLENAAIVGKTPIGRATVFLLMLNAPTRVLNRQILIDQKRYP
jgi:hypothetical protein